MDRPCGIVFAEGIAELPKTDFGGIPAGVKDLCVRCEGGGPAGVVEGWEKRKLCPFGVDGGCCAENAMMAREAEDV